MKRALVLLFIIVICIVGFLSTRGAMPFMPVIGSNTEPEILSGSLLMIDSIDPQDVAVGDIIVYSVPDVVREQYDYPPVVARPVISVNTKQPLSFRTTDANNDKYPFLVRPHDIKGTMGSQIPYLGMPFLPFLSQPGLIITIFVLVLLALFLYRSELTHSWRKLQIRIPSWRKLHIRIPSLSTNRKKSTNWMIARKIEAAEEKMTATEEALKKFTTAIADYAQHMASHTSAIQGLRAASFELKRGAAEQNRILMQFIKNMEPPTARLEKPSWKIEHATPEPGKPAPEAKKPVTKPVIEKPVAKPVTEEPVSEELVEEKSVTRQWAEKPVVEKLVTEKSVAQEPIAEKTVPESVIVESVSEPIHEIPEKPKTQFPPGCARNRRATTSQVPAAKPRLSHERQELITEALTAEQEILKKVKRSRYQV